MTFRTLRQIAPVALLVCCCLFAIGCETSETTASSDAVSPGALPLCTDCGQIKGDEKCCDPSQATCGGCDLAKGSPGCCKITKGTDEAKALCTGCGQIKGGDTCCEPGQAKCSKCGLVAGSPGCCKIK